MEREIVGCPKNIPGMGKLDGSRDGCVGIAEDCAGCPVYRGQARTEESMLKGEEGIGCVDG